ncbi:hypothetical protein [Flavobacterium sp.]|uniref:hypothetical protein n=1 Tax=Flavobacterium sp. TaxID=239 RepID=UPI002605A12E|nr:hypothetical protein [Flavobacterium sp.]
MKEVTQRSEIGTSSNISKTLLDELFNPSLDLSIDYSEIYIDDLIENETLKEIPIVKSVIGVIRGGISINQFWFAKKLLTFIQEFNSGKIDSEKISNYKQKLEADPKFGKKVAERLMIFIDRNIEITQTKITSNLFGAYVSKEITYEELCDILISLDKLNPTTFNGFFKLEKHNFIITEQNHEEVGERDFELESLITSSGFAVEISSWFHGFRLTNIGDKLFEFGIKPLKK